MRKLTAFNHLSLDGFFTGVNGDFSWAHSGPPDPEFDAFVAGNARGGGHLVFGRITYQIMAGYWPSPQAHANNPTVAEGMNRMPKSVFSRTLDHVSWSNTHLLKGDLAAEIRRLKEQPGDDMVILGSGSLIAQLAPHRLIDTYQFVLDPLALGKGRTMFESLPERLALKLISTRTFPSGKVFLTYETLP